MAHDPAIIKGILMSSNTGKISKVGFHLSIWRDHPTFLYRYGSARSMLEKGDTLAKKDIPLIDLYTRSYNHDTNDYMKYSFVTSISADYVPTWQVHRQGLISIYCQESHRTKLFPGFGCEGLTMQEDHLQSTKINNLHFQ